MASPDIESCTDDARAMTVAQANNFLALSMYKLLAEEKKNVFFSPFSVSTALAMLFCCAKGETAQEMRNVLGYEYASIQDEEVVTSFREVLAAIDENTDSYVLNYANSILSQKNLDVKDEYKLKMKASFKALIMEVDFCKESQKVVNEINNWVKENTNGMIPYLLNSLDPSTVMVILNAIYFKGTWLHQFRESSTFSQNFYNYGKEENAKQVDMMHQKENFPFVKKEAFGVLQLPYKGKNIAMLIFLPHARDGLDELEVSLNSTFIQDLKAEMIETKVEVALPKFRLEYSKSLTGSLQRLGMNGVFQPEADLSEMSDSKNLKVSEIFHKAVLEVNEVGSEAAAVTAVMLKRKLIRCPKFIVDHPFAFVIYNTRSDLIFFLGRVNQL